jgi:hypothetical protein
MGKEVGSVSLTKHLAATNGAKAQAENDPLPCFDHRR